MKSAWSPALLALFLFECVPAARSDGPVTPEESQECRVRAGEVISIRDPRMKDPDCIIEVGAAFSVSWNEYKVTPIKKVEMKLTPLCGREDEIILLEQEATEKLFSLQSMPIDIKRTPLKCGPSPKVDVVILETGV